MSLFDFYGNGEAANKWFGMKVYIVVDTSMLFILSFDVFKGHRRKAHLTDVRLQFQKLFGTLDNQSNIFQVVELSWNPFRYLIRSLKKRKRKGDFMHAPYRRYLEVYSSVAVTQVLSVWCVHEISVRFPEVC